MASDSGRIMESRLNEFGNVLIIGFLSGKNDRVYYKRHYKIFCVNGKYGIQVEFRIFYFYSFAK